MYWKELAFKFKTTIFMTKKGDHVRVDVGSGPIHDGIMSNINVNTTIMHIMRFFIVSYRANEVAIRPYLHTY